jgi:hypothetical protein
MKDGKEAEGTKKKKRYRKIGRRRKEKTQGERKGIEACTVIRLVSVSAKFGIFTVMGLNGTCALKLEYSH